MRKLVVQINQGDDGRFSISSDLVLGVSDADAVPALYAIQHGLDLLNKDSRRPKQGRKIGFVMDKGE